MSLGDGLITFLSVFVAVVLTLPWLGRALPGPAVHAGGPDAGTGGWLWVG
jgi:hypothetical protein